MFFGLYSNVVFDFVKVLFEQKKNISYLILSYSVTLEENGSIRYTPKCLRLQASKSDKLSKALVHLSLPSQMHLILNVC